MRTSPGSEGHIVFTVNRWFMLGKTSRSLKALQLFGSDATGTREILVRPNYVMIYRITGDVVEVLRVLHATQQWP